LRIQGVAMSEAEFGPEVAREHVEAALADPALASLRLADAPVVVIAGSPGRVVYANQGAQSLFVGDLPALGRRLLLGAEPGARRVVALSRSLLPGAAPRLERLRFFFGPVAETVTVLCRRVTVASGETLFALAVLGLRASQTTARRSGDVEPPPLKAPGDAIETKPAVSASASDAADAPAPAADSSAADLAARAPAEAEDALREGAAPARGARFAWRTDGDHVVAFVAPALAAEIGAANADIVGRSFVDIARDMRLDADGRLAAALAARQTFAGVETSWPAGEGLVARIALGAAPAFDEEDRFDGFRGYGVVHPERLAAPATAPVAERDVATAATDEAEAEAAFFAPYAAEAAGAATPQPDIQPTAAADEDADEANDNETDLRDEAGEIVAVSDAGEPMHRGDIGSEPAGQPVDEAEPLFEDELPADDEAEEPAPSAGNIVPLRPQQPARRADTALRSPAAELSPGEKSAFEEIGRTLGVERAAESADDEPKLSPAATKRARDLIDLVARFGRSDEPAEQPAPPPPPLAAVSEDTSAQIAAQLPERNAAAVLERLPVGIVVSRFNVPIYANRTLLELLDYSDIDAFHAAGGLDRLFRGRAPDSGAAQIETRDGEVLPVDARVQAVDWDGQPATLVTLRRAQENRPQENRSQENRPQENRPQDAGDAARAKALELDLRQRDAEARELHAILDTATDGVAVLDADGRILSLNRSGEALFGFDQNEVAGEPLSILVARESQDAVAAYFDGVKSGGVQSVLNDGREIFARARQGGSIPVFVTLGRLGSGATPKFCAVLRDLTAWKKAERELGDARREAERASALKSDFLAKVSHEIRTPLNAILGFAEVIMDERFGPVGNARYRDYMRDIHKSGEHVLSLVNDLLDLSKIEAGKVDLTFTSVDINAVVAECVSLMQPQANRDRVVMRLSLAPNLPNIVADERSMRQIVLNLLSNAVKFNEPGGQAIVSTALTDAGHAVVRIKDTGVGMSDDELQTALEPFRQVSTARKSGGTGLGLPLTKALVEANRASFTIRSRKGEGTMVEVTFPPTRVLAE